MRRTTSHVTVVMVRVVWRVVDLLTWRDCLYGLMIVFHSSLERRLNFCMFKFLALV